LERLKVIILCPEEPSDTLRYSVLEDPYLDDRVVYIRGSPLHVHDLDRCKASEAKCFLVLTNAMSDDKASQDPYAVLCALALNHYAPNVHTMTQLLYSSNMHYLSEVDIIYLFIYLSEVDTSLTGLHNSHNILY